MHKTVGYKYTYTPLNKVISILTNDEHYSTIYFNQAGHAPNQATVQLVYQRRYSGTGDGSIRIYISSGASVIPVKIRIYKLADEFD